jgi:hypothetical protein
MYAVVKYPENYSTYTSDDYSDCVDYLVTLNDLLKRFTINTELTETFLIVKRATSESVYSIEYINQN